MEKSMVHELNVLAGSQLVNRSSFITTAFQQTNYDLRKSRIQNLPNYNKVDLSGKLQFVVVFQTMQIERLSNEVEALRVSLKDKQRQIFNVHNYEVQIRELTEKCHNYEVDRTAYLQEIDKLNIICENLYQQLESMKSRYSDIDPTINEKYKLEKQRNSRLEEDLERWKARYSALESSKNRQLEDMKIMFESQRKSVVDRQIKELTIKFSSQRQNLENQIRKLRENLNSRQSQLQRATSQVSRLQIVNQEMSSYESTIQEYENKFAMISQETMRLNDRLRHKQQQIQKLNYTITTYQRRIAELQRSLQQNRRGQQKLRVYETTIEEWKTKYSRLEDQKHYNQSQLSKIPELQNQIRILASENENLKNSMRDKMQDIQQWQYKFEKVSSQYNLRHQQAAQKLPTLERRINQLNEENDRLNQSLRGRTSQIQNWKLKCKTFQRQISNFSSIGNQKKDVQDKLSHQVKICHELQTRVHQLDTRLRKYGDMQRELENQRSSKQQYVRQIQRLNSSLRSISGQIDNYKRKCSQLEGQMRTFIQIKEQIKIYKQKQVSLARQIDRINSIISQKIKEIQSLKQMFYKIQNSAQQNQNFERKMFDIMNKMQGMVQSLDKSQKEAEFYHNKFITAQSEAKKYKNDLYNLNQQKDQAIRIINTKSKQLENFENQLHNLRGQIGSLRQKQSKFQQIENKYRTIQSKFSELEILYRKEQNRSMELNDSLQQYVQELNKIKMQGVVSQKFREEFLEVKLSCEQKDKQIRNFQLRLNTAEKILAQLKKALQINDQLMKRNHQKWLSVGKKMDFACSAVKRMNELENEILKLNEANFSLQGKVNVLQKVQKTVNQTSHIAGMEGLPSIENISQFSNVEQSIIKRHDLNQYPTISVSKPKIERERQRQTIIYEHFHKDMDNGQAQYSLKRDSSSNEIFGRQASNRPSNNYNFQYKGYGGFGDLGGPENLNLNNTYTTISRVTSTNNFSPAPFRKTETSSYLISNNGGRISMNDQLGQQKNRSALSPLQYRQNNNNSRWA